MTYTKLIERLYNSHDAETLCADAALVIEALQAEAASLKQISELNAQIAIYLKAERDQLQSKLDALEKQEPIYQYQMGDGSWIDQTKHSYDYNRNHAPNAVVRIVYAAPKALAPEQAEAAWRAGWSACRDAEYAGQEAEDEAWGMSETCANADWESTAPKACEPLTPDERQQVVELLDKEGHDSKDFEPECPLCTARQKLAAHGIGGTP